MKLFTMTKTVTKNLLKGPATRRYPKVPRTYTALSRGHIDIRIAECIFCGLCMRRCPTYAIQVTKNHKEWEIDRLKCCTCNLCVEICPTKCLSMENQYSPPVTERASALYKKNVPIPEAGLPSTP
jgi:ech hydrogenase subunit F